MFKFQVKNATRIARTSHVDVTSAGKTTNDDSVTEGEQGNWTDEDDSQEDCILYSRKNKNKATQVESKSAPSLMPNNQISTDLTKENKRVTRSASKKLASINNSLDLQKSCSSNSDSFDSTSRTGTKRKLERSPPTSKQNGSTSPTSPTNPTKKSQSFEESRLLKSICGKNDEVLLIQPDDPFPADKSLSNPFRPSVPSKINSKSKQTQSSMTKNGPKVKQSNTTFTKSSNGHNTLPRIVEEPEEILDLCIRNGLPRKSTTKQNGRSPSVSQTLTSSQGSEATELSVSLSYLSDYENCEPNSNCSVSTESISCTLNSEDSDNHSTISKRSANKVKRLQNSSVDSSIKKRGRKNSAKNKQNLRNCCNSSFSDAVSVNEFEEESDNNSVSDKLSKRRETSQTTKWKNLLPRVTNKEKHQPVKLPKRIIESFSSDHDTALPNNGMGKYRNPATGEIGMTELVKHIDEASWETCFNGNGNQMQLSEAFTLGKSGNSTGFMKLAPGVTKPLMYNLEDCVTFVVLSGTALVQLFTHSWTVKKYSTFLVIQGNPYRISNTGEKDLLLFMSMCHGIPLRDMA